VGALEEGVEFVTHDFVGEGQYSLPYGMYVWLFGKVKMRKEVSCGLSSETKEAQLVKVDAQVLCGFKDVTLLEVVTGNVDV